MRRGIPPEVRSLVPKVHAWVNCSQIYEVSDSTRYIDYGARIE